MSSERSGSQRRSFLGGLNGAAAALAALAAGGAAQFQLKAAVAARWEPTRHQKDDWLDQSAAKHRMVFDTITPEGFGEALLFGTNYMRVNRSDYGIANSELAVVIVVRHRSVVFAYNDAMWAKYGAAISAHAKFVDPRSKQAPRINVYSAEDYGDLAANRGATIESVTRQGVQLAVCSVATSNVAGSIGAAMGVNWQDVFKELTANLVSNARMVPAGIVTVNRAQERGYSLVAS